MRTMILGWWALCMLSTLVTASTGDAGGYRDAFRSLPKRDSETMKLWSKDDWTDSELQAFLVSTQPSMDLLLKASTKPFGGWGTQTPITPETELDYLSPARLLARMAFRHIEYHLDQGDADQAVELLLAVNQLSLAVDHDPAVICRLVAGGIQAGAIESAVGRLGRFSAEQRGKLAETLGRPLSSERFAERTADEFAGAVDFLLLAPVDQWQSRAKVLGARANVIDEYHEGRWRDQLERLKLRLPDVRRVFMSPMTDQIRMGRALDRSLSQLGSLAEAVSPGFERMAETSTRLTIDARAFAAACDVLTRGDDAIRDHIDPSNGRPFVLRRESEQVFEVISGLTLKDRPFGLRVGDPSNARP